MGENINFLYYSEEMGRDIIPDEATFNRYKLENELQLRNFLSLGIIKEKEKGNFDKAVCMMIEVQYVDELKANGEGAKNSENIEGYSYSVSEETKLIQQKNFKTTLDKKLAWIEMFCDIKMGVI